MRRSAQPASEERPVLMVPRQSLIDDISEQIRLGCELRDTDIDEQDVFDAVVTGYGHWYAYNCEMLRRAASTDELMTRFQRALDVRLVFDELTTREKIEEVHRNLQDGIAKLRTILTVLPLVPEGHADHFSPSSGKKETGVTSKTVFIVHGHDEDAKESVARLIQRLGLEPLILHEQSDRGRTIIEKFEAHADTAQFAVILLTPDDVGGDDRARLCSRARQNVILELGYFLGKLGRQGICALHKGELELPSDIAGVLYTPLDQAGAWRTTVARELKSAGFSVDLNKLAD